MPTLRPRREADDVTRPQLTLVPLRAKRRRPLDHDQPLLHPVVEVVGESPLALVQVVEAAPDPLRTEQPSEGRRAPAEALAHLAVAPVGGIHPEEVHLAHGPDAKARAPPAARAGRR